MQPGLVLRSYQRRNRYHDCLGPSRPCTLYGPSELQVFTRGLGFVLNKDSGTKRIVIQDFRFEGGLDEEATFLAERGGVGAYRTLLPRAHRVDDRRVIQRYHPYASFRRTLARLPTRIRSL
jgi:hypothetical protein